MAVTISRGHLLRFIDPPEEPEPPPPPGVVPVFNPALISEALTWTTPVFTWEPGFDASAVIGAECAMYFLSLVAFYNPSNVAAVNKTRDIIINSLSPDKDPVLNGLFGWGQPLMGATILLAKNTPAVWDQLSTDMKTRCDWLMRVFAIVGNFIHNSAHAVRLDVPLVRNGGFLPNQRGFVGPMSYNYLYWGGAAPVQAILSSFDWNEYIARFNQYGWSRNRGIWTSNSQTRAMFEGTRLSYTHPTNGQSATVTAQGVRRPFDFKGITVNDTTGVRGNGPVVSFTPLNMMLHEECGYMYGIAIRDVAVTSLVNPGGECHGVTGHINGAGSAHLGEVGMCYEFSANPEGRSSFHYCAAGNRSTIAHWATLYALGVDLSSIHDHLWYANEHLYYEAAIQGWYTADGQGRCQDIRGESSVNNWRHGYIFNKEIYRAMFRALVP